MRDNFYVDDGLTSCPTPEEAIQILKDTQSALKEFGNLRLHKFASNSPKVMSAFPSEDLATNLKDLDLHGEEKSLQRSLGLNWDVNNDAFLFQLSTDNKPVTRRGLLSTVNGIFDPLGFLAPVTIYGKLLLRELVAETQNWDEPLPDDLASLWNSWKCSLNVLEDLRFSTYVCYRSKQSCDKGTSRVQRRLRKGYSGRHLPTYYRQRRTSQAWICSRQSQSRTH